MLKNLYIKNVAVARSVSVDFDEGLTVLTGETGAGKSIIVDCINIISGAKFSKNFIRYGEDRAVLNALFEVPEGDDDIFDSSGIDRDDNRELMITRQISSSGSSNLKCNGQPITVTQLRRGCRKLFSITGQNDMNQLLDSGEYITMLDQYSADSGMLSEYEAEYRKYTELKKELEAFRKDVKEKTMMTEILEYQVNEIKKAKLQNDDEEEKLRTLKEKLKNNEKISKNSRLIYKALYSNENGYSAADLIEKSAAAVEKISDFIDGSDEIIRKLRDFRYEIIDIAERINDSLAIDTEGDPTEMLDKIESRLYLIEKLKGKYGSTVSEIKEYCRRSENTLRDLENSEQAEEEYRKRLSEQTAVLSAAADKIHAARASGAEKLSAAVEKQIRNLDMPKARFRIDVTVRKGSDGFLFGPDGYDDVSFMIAVNPGEQLMVLKDVASGGELSRVMLSLMAVMNSSMGTSTVIFDEIDSGVSGSTSEKIGLLLKQISGKCQVICITHSPQIASLADEHFLIEKNEIDGRAESSVRKLSFEERVDEISRIIGGINVTEKQTEAAREMLINGTGK